MTDFVAWDKYDVESALAQVEDEGKLEDKRRAEVARDALQTKSQEEVLKEAVFAAGALKSRAAVEALKLKQSNSKRGRRSAPSQQGSGTLATSAILGASEVDALQALATRVSEATCGLKAAWELRNEAGKQLEKSDSQAAIGDARACLARLDTVQPLLRSGTEEVKNMPCSEHKNSDESHNEHSCGHGHSHEHSNANTSAGANEAGPTDGCTANGSHDHSHHHGHSCSNHDRKQKGIDSTMEGSRPDLLKISKSLRYECRMIIGAAMLRIGCTAKATETFRDVLLEEPDRVRAWVARGGAFRGSGVPLLASLHIERALQLDSDNSSALKERSLVDDAWKAQAKDIVNKIKGEETDAELVPPWALKTQYSADVSPKRMLEEGLESYRMGCVLHQEQFFKSAARRFAHAIATLQPLYTSMLDKNVLLDISTSINHAPVDNLGVNGATIELLNTNTCTSEGISNACTSERHSHTCTSESNTCTNKGVSDTCTSEIHPNTCSEGIPNTYTSEVLCRMLVACHLNIAAEALLRGRVMDGATAERHCNAALLLDPSCKTALARKTRALELQATQGLVSNSTHTTYTSININTECSLGEIESDTNTYTHNDSNNVYIDGVKNTDMGIHEESSKGKLPAEDVHIERNNVLNAWIGIGS